MPDASSISAEFPFAPHYVDVLGSKMHYVDEGEGEPVLFLHGNPTSSYLWRNVIPHVAPHARCIAPDLIGMGRSDRPDLPYRFFDHARYVDAFIERLGLEHLTLVVHDWGSGLGFHYASRHPSNVRGVAFMEAIVRPPRWSNFPPGFRIGFKMMRTPGVGWLMVCVLNAFVRQILPRATHRKLTREEMRRYASAFPTVASRKPVLQWPREIPIDGEPADVHAVVSAYCEWLQRSDVPKLLLHADPGGLIPASTVAWCREHFPNLEAVPIGTGIHYVQEDNPHGIGEAVAAWYRSLPPASPPQP